MKKNIQSGSASRQKVKTNNNTTNNHHQQPLHEPGMPSSVLLSKPGKPSAALSFAVLSNKSSEPLKSSKPLAVPSKSSEPSNFP
jgi:hypothetical protein